MAGETLFNWHYMKLKTAITVASHFFRVFKLDIKTFLQSSAFHARVLKRALFFFNSIKQKNNITTPKEFFLQFFGRVRFLNEHDLK